MGAVGSVRGRGLVRQVLDPVDGHHGVGQEHLPAGEVLREVVRHVGRAERNGVTVSEGEVSARDVPEARDRSPDDLGREALVRLELRRNPLRLVAGNGNAVDGNRLEHRQPLLGRPERVRAVRHAEDDREGLSLRHLRLVALHPEGPLAVHVVVRTGFRSCFVRVRVQSAFLPFFLCGKVGTQKNTEVLVLRLTAYIIKLY